MTKKLSFSVEDAKMIDENPDSNFAVLSLDFFASGENLHDMYVSEETLMRTANTIKNCPLVWKYDEKLDDIYTHDKDEVPCGFVPESSVVESKKLQDGRIMLSVIAYVWKRYTGELLNFFKRDGGKKPVSVEMSVYNTRPLSNGLIELLDFRYEGITVLGSFVTPAIPLANASVLSFSKIKEEYNEAFEKEFSYISGDMKIPEEVKRNAKKGLELRKEFNKGTTSVELAFAKYLTQNEEISSEKAKYIVGYFSKHKGKDFQEANPPSTAYVSSMLLGGITAWKWAQSIVDEMERQENKKAYAEIVTFPYKSIDDMNPALKGINPPITVSQGNQIAKQAESIGSDEKKNGWAIAISSFKKTHVVKDGKWVEKNSEKMEMTMDKELEGKTAEELLEMAAEEEKKRLEEEKAKEEEVEKEKNFEAQKNGEEEKEPEPKKFELPKNFNLETMQSMFAEKEEEEEEEEEEVKMAKEELAKGEFADPSVIMAGMFAKMCKMTSMIAKLAESNKVYMEENNELKKFKADVEIQQKNFEVEKTLKELSDKVILPAEAKEEMLAEAEKYTFATIEEWKTYCKAKSFDFAVRENGKKDDVVEVGLPFTAEALKKKDDLWAS